VIAGLAGSILVAAVVALDHRSTNDSIVDDEPPLAELDPIRPARRSSLQSVYNGLLPSQPATGKASVPPASRISP
jgi:hypothetical protein